MRYTLFTVKLSNIYFLLNWHEIVNKLVNCKEKVDGFENVSPYLEYFVALLELMKIVKWKFN